MQHSLRSPSQAQRALIPLLLQVNEPFLPTFFLNMECTAHWSLRSLPINDWFSTCLSAKLGLSTDSYHLLLNSLVFWYFRGKNNYFIDTLIPFPFIVPRGMFHSVLQYLNAFFWYISLLYVYWSYSLNNKSTTVLDTKLFFSH